jgi:MFS family permease
MRRLSAQARVHAVAPLAARTRGLGRFCLAAFGVDGAFYLALTGVPYKAIHLGAPPLVLGLLPAVWSVVYITGCGVAGRLSDRVSRIRMARLGTSIVVLAVLAIAATPSIPGLFAGLAIAAMGLSLFWPALQAAVAETGDPSRLDQELGWFNISWSAGKSTGFLVGGVLLAAFGFGALFGVSIAVVLLVTLLLGRLPTGSAAVPAGAQPLPVVSAEPSVPARRRRSFLLVAWVANGASYGAAATLNYHYPRLLRDLGLGSDLFGAFLGLVYLSQTITFLLLMRTGRWHYRRWPLYLAQAGFVVLLFTLPWIHRPGLALLLSPLAGLEMGLAYFSSIYYSLHVAERPGRNTGYHEAVIGSGTLLVPSIGGWLATRFGGLSIPFLFCGSVILLAMVAQEIIMRRRVGG